MATITYKGEEREISINNRALMKYEMMGGSFSKFEVNPVSESVKLCCAALDLPGDPIDHANDLPSIQDLAEIMKDALSSSGYAGEPGKLNG